jgi:hypothetical protein
MLLSPLLILPLNILCKKLWVYNFQSWFSSCPRYTIWKKSNIIGPIKELTVLYEILLFSKTRKSYYWVWQTSFVEVNKL